MADFIYMDNAATTFPKAETTYEAMDDANRNLAVNAGRGSYALAKRASSVIDEVRVRLCRLMSAETAAEVFLTTDIVNNSWHIYHKDISTYAALSKAS